MVLKDFQYDYWKVLKIDLKKSILSKFLVFIEKLLKDLFKSNKILIPNENKCNTYFLIVSNLSDAYKRQKQ